ncbi:MAG: polyprenyl diphosphate synthase [Candidatus Aenigmarchaeota archaeon]|nr:polyprenyl diphosphate synthase [Candidatus Aenigmarchaeota archaeon]
MDMIPNHIGLIMDGNRRFARELVKRPWEGHLFGLKKSRDVLQWTCEAGIKYMTIYTLSLENISTRPKRELQIILKYLGEEADNVLKNKNHPIHKFNVKTRFIGRIHVLPDYLQAKLKKVEEATKNYKNHILNIAVAYGGQQEIIDAVKEIMLKGLKGIIKPSDVDEKIMKEHLYTNGQPYPDLIVRSGGEVRLSNFLPFQSVYSELIFTNKKWPELTKKDFDSFLVEFAKRQRKFGK